MKKLSFCILCTAALLLCALSAIPAPKNFPPDFTFKGSTLTGWHTLGSAKWQAANGEITGSAANGAGWLISDASLQDVALDFAFRCTGPCKTGVLFRAQKTADGGLKGIFASLTDGDLASYRVTLDSSGKELTRERLVPGGGETRYASVGKALTPGLNGVPLEPGMAGYAPPQPSSEETPAAGRGAAGRGGAGAAAGRGGAGAAGAGRGGGRGGRGAAPTTIPADQPNHIQFILDADVLRVALGSGGASGGDTGDAGGGFGQIALFAGSGEVRFSDLAWQDLRSKVFPAEQVSSRFREQQVSPFSYTYSAATADINRDGIPDIVAGPYYYLGPDYTQYREIYFAETYSPGGVAPIFSRVQFAYDFTGDGWPDVIRVAPSDVTLYVNPQKESKRWERYHVLNVSTELALLRDVDGDGKPELVYGGSGVYAYANPDPANPTGPWITHAVSENVPVAGHGLGVGDVNRDGRQDIIAPAGWWEQPPKGTPAGVWKFHPADLAGGRGGGAEMCVYDANGDGLNDVVTSLAGHGWGLAWFEQKPDGAFTQHMIMDDYSTQNAGNVTFSELHGSACADMDGDGIPDFITGKRFWSHLEGYSGPDPYGTPVLYIYHTKRNPKAPGGAEFVPELIHNRSGIGSTIVVQDLNKDGAIDLATSTNLGTYIFWGKPAAKTAAKTISSPARAGSANQKAR